MILPLLEKILSIPDHLQHLFFQHLFAETANETSTSIGDGVIGLVGKGRIEGRIEPCRIHTSLQFKVILQRIGRVRVRAGYGRYVPLAPPLHLDRSPAFGLIDMPIAQIHLGWNRNPMCSSVGKNERQRKWSSRTKRLRRSMAARDG